VPSFASQHIRQNSFDGIQNAEDVDPEHALDVGHVDWVEQRWCADTRIGNQEVDWTKLVANRCNGSLDFSALADVSPHQGALAASLADLRGNFTKQAGSPRNQADPATLAGKVRRHRAANAT
jgi:hypothetical protein